MEAAQLIAEKASDEARKLLLKKHLMKQRTYC
jgi:hypothetical protein